MRRGGRKRIRIPSTYPHPEQGREGLAPLGRRTTKNSQWRRPSGWRQHSGNAAGTNGPIRKVPRNQSKRPTILNIAPNKLTAWLALLAMVLEDDTISIIRGPPRHRDMGPWAWDAPGTSTRRMNAMWVSRDGSLGQRCVEFSSYFLSLTAPSKPTNN